MNMNVVIMCDWECTADACQDNMGASHPSRLVDEQEKSAEPRWCMGCAGGAGRDQPLLSAPCLRLRRFPAAPFREGGCSFSVEVVVTLCLTRAISHNFFNNSTSENNQALVSHIHLYRHAHLSLCLSVKAGSQKKMSLHQHLYIQCKFYSTITVCVSVVVECTLFRPI